MLTRSLKQAPLQPSINLEQVQELEISHKIQVHLTEETKTKVDLNHPQAIKKLKSHPITATQTYNNQKAKTSLQHIEDLL